MASELLQLSTIISSSVEELLAFSTENAWSLPVLSEPFDPAKNLFRQNANASHTAAKIIAAAMQLATTLMTPTQAIQSCTGGPTKAAAMRVCLGLNVPEILRDAGPEGMHVVDIVQKSGSRVDSDKLARIMRYLANSHFYREVKPDVFAHTMTSSVLDTGKAIQEILADPAAKHNGTRGPVALCDLDEVAKASTMLLENMTDPKTAFSDDPTHSPSQRVFKHDLPLYDWYELPENTYRRRRFGIGMIGLAALRGESILEEFDWSTVPEGSVVVDVGGGFGASAKFIISHAPQVRVVVQDKPEVVTAGRQLWRENSKNKILGHDIFTPQPGNHATVFVLKNIIHNWGDSYSLKMLSHLRAAASPDTKLLVIGSILQHLCPSAHNSGSAPLLPSYGVVGDSQYLLDMVMLNTFNAREHTAESLDALLRKSGWKLDTIYGTENIGDGLQLTVASPI
ncbi:O-methyltransferase-domain-containing protein [Mycena vulgaris]|nr:O-methyltransferase-domain-containing protein [Mycena vulgaris]